MREGRYLCFDRPNDGDGVPFVAFDQSDHTSFGVRGLHAQFVRNDGILTNGNATILPPVSVRR